MLLESFKSMFKSIVELMDDLTICSKPWNFEALGHLTSDLFVFHDSGTLKSQNFLR